LLANVELVAASDMSSEALASADLNGAQRYGDAHTMLTEVQPDMVIVATNGPSHHQLVLDAVSSGARSVLCEKPMACSIAEAEEMIHAARKSECALAVNHSRRHVPAYIWLAQQIQTATWGELRSVQSSWPGAGLGCLATHLVDLWRFLGGQEINTVFGWIDPIRGRNPRGSEYVDPGGTILAVSASGVRYVHEQVEDGGGPGKMTIDTTEAQIEIDERRGSIEVIVRDRSVKPGPGRPPKYDHVSPPADAALALDIIQLSACAIRELAAENKLTCEAEHGLRSLEVVMAAHLSHRQGHTPISLPITDDKLKAMRLQIT
jgi:predicted dehydrogenase